MKQPTWCKLPPEKFDLVAGRVGPDIPENILFTRALPLLPQQEQDDAGAESDTGAVHQLPGAASEQSDDMTGQREEESVAFQLQREQGEQSSEQLTVNDSVTAQQLQHQHHLPAVQSGQGQDHALPVQMHALDRSGQTAVQYQLTSRLRR